MTNLKICLAFSALICDRISANYVGYCPKGCTTTKYGIIDTIKIFEPHNLFNTYFL